MAEGVKNLTNFMFMKMWSCTGWIDWGVFGEKDHISSGSDYQIGQRVRQIVISNAGCLSVTHLNQKEKCERSKNTLEGVYSLGRLTYNALKRLS